MGKMNILFDKKSPQKIDSDINIDIDFDSIIDYKVIVGNEGIWNIVKDFQEEGSCVWTPKQEGNYIIMVQGKKRDSKKPYDFLAREEFIIEGSDRSERIITSINLDREEYFQGDKLNITVNTDTDNILTRLYRSDGADWELIRDYSPENIFSYPLIECKEEEILVECKKLDSTESFDDFQTFKVFVKEKGKIEISDFKCLNDKLILSDELVFKVDTTNGENKALLYKFIKIDEDGKRTCIQDYSSKNIVSFQETKKGKYKLLCLMKDILSLKEYDDRAIIVYKVIPYDEIKIKSVITDIKSPQKVGTDINIGVLSDGGNEVIYRYIIEGPIADDSCYTRSDRFTWSPKAEGSYKITIYAKDSSFKGDYEDKKTIMFDIDKKSEKPVRVVDLICDTKKETVIGKPINIRVIAEGGTVLNYAFTIYRNGKLHDRIGFSKTNWINFTPKEKGEYEINIKVKDRYSNYEYDVENKYFINVKDYFPGNIEYILLPHRSNYLVGDFIDIEIVVQDTKNTEINFVTKINSHAVEETGFITNKKMCIKPKCAGKYTFIAYARNIKCDKDYDSKKEISIIVENAIPVTGTRVIFNRADLVLNKEINFEVVSIGGKEVCYEFYIMEKGNWIKAQSYSRKRFYSFIPYSKGDYRILVLAKSYHKRVNYEDYFEAEFTVE